MIKILVEEYVDEFETLSMNARFVIGCEHLALTEEGQLVDL